MKLKTCYYCGTKYSEEEKRCPLCGQTEVEPEEIDEVTAATAAPTPVDDDDDDEMEYEVKNKSYAKSERKQNIVSAVVCVLLALVVVAGILFILNAVGVFGPKEPAKDPSLNLPVTDDPGNTVLCTGLEVTPASMSFAAKDASSKITASILPADCTEEVTYVSTNESVAKVAADGTVTAVGEGSASITVTCGTQVKTVAVICSFESAPPVVIPSDVDLSKLSLNIEDVTLNNKNGLTCTLRVKGLPEGSDVKVQWEVGDPDVATVVDGKVTAVGTGTTKAYAIIGEKKLTCILRCTVEGSAPSTDNDPDTDPVVNTGVKISHTDVTLSKQNGLTFTIRLSKDGVKLANVEWTSSKPNVCTVNEAGLVTAVGNGSAKITATFEGTTYSCTVYCYID